MEGAFMAVYKRGYEPYQGRLTPQWSRFLIIARYAWRRLSDSRWLIGFLVLCSIYPAVCAVLIYLPHNAAVAELLGKIRLIQIDPAFFLKFVSEQGSVAFILTGFVGPGLVSPDLTNNALPLYLCRPFSRTEYVIGKMSVLALLISAISWAPGLLLFGFQAYLAGFGWLAGNWWIAAAILLGSWIWIVTLCLLALAMSAWVKWKVVAGTLIFVVFFLAAGLAEAISAALHTDLGHVLNLFEVIKTICRWLFSGADALRVPIGSYVKLGDSDSSRLPIGVAWAALAGFWALCFVLLNTKLRAYHVERS
jgi:ABC-type transport system involved in multi-copper enzyme maturation permease subunit